MASTCKCQYCDSTITSRDQKCPNCGAPNPNYVEDTPRTVFLPKTIAELKEYCAERGMPLLRMRFFIGEDFREPRAFGIYQYGDTFIVYKNKSDGTRAIRYQGPDEAYAVNEIFTKLLSECHNRGIYPDGAPPVRKTAPKKNFIDRSRIISLVLFLAVATAFIVLSVVQHRGDGYYNFNDGKLWYRDGTGWYYTYGGAYGDWYDGSAPAVEGDYKDYYQGDDFQSDWGVSNFKLSETYEEHHKSSSDSDSDSGSDYDSWDSGDTDWDSDW